MSARLAWLAVSALMLGACGADGPDAADPATAGADDVIRVTGELRSAEARSYGPPAVNDMWNFTIAYMAPEGSVVEAGTPILRFDTQDLMTRVRDKRNELNQKQKELEKQEIVRREQLAELRLNLQEAEATRDKARLKAEIPKDLLASRDYRENQLLWQKAETALEQAAADLELETRIQATEISILEREIGVLDAEIAQLQRSIGLMNITAPGPGVVVHAVDRRNNKMSVGDNVWMGRRVIELLDLSRLVLHIEIPERESARVRSGQRVRFALDAAPEQQFQGEIVELASVIHTRSSNQPAKVFDAVVALNNPNLELMRPGMSVNAEILAGEAAGAGP